MSVLHRLSRASRFVPRGGSSVGNVPYLYEDVVLEHSSKNTGVGIAYYKISIPTEEFQDFKYAFVGRFIADR